MQQRRIRGEILVLSKKGDLAGARRLLADQIDVSDAVLGPLGAQLVKDGARQAEDALRAGQADYRRGMAGGITFSALGIVLGSLLGLVVARGIHEPLKAFGLVLGSVARGDLTAQATLDRKDEFGRLGQDLNAMVGDLKGVLQGVRASVEGVASGATQLSASADQMAATSTSIAGTSD